MAISSNTPPTSKYRELSGSDQLQGRPLVSVIIPVFNRPKSLAAALRSVFAQTFPDWEVVVVDDCSTDRTVELIENLHDPRILVHRNPVNRREVYSFGRAIEIARGDIVFLADQDAVWRPRSAGSARKTHISEPITSKVAT